MTRSATGQSNEWRMEFVYSVTSTTLASGVIYGKWILFNPSEGYFLLPEALARITSPISYPMFKLRRWRPRRILGSSHESSEIETPKCWQLVPRPIRCSALSGDQSSTFMTSVSEIPFVSIMNPTRPRRTDSSKCILLNTVRANTVTFQKSFTAEPQEPGTRYHPIS